MHFNLIALLVLLMMVSIALVVAAQKGEAVEEGMYGEQGAGRPMGMPGGGGVPAFDGGR